VFRLLPTTGCLVLVLLCLTGCQSSFAPVTSPNNSLSPAHNTAKSAGVLRLNLGSEPPTLDPVRVTDLTSMTVLNQLMVGLTRIDGQSQIVPAVAKAWQVTNNGRTYTFTLNPTAKWSDGLPLTAQHVADGLQRALTAANGSEYAFFLFDIVGAKAFYEGKTLSFKTVAVQVLGPHQLRLTLTHPVAFFTSLMAFPVAYPARLDVIKRHGDAWTEAGNFVGNGPYTLQAWRHDDHLSLVPSPQPWLPPVKGGASAGPLPRVEMGMINDANTSMVLYENHQLDYIESPSTLPSPDIRRVKHRADFHQAPLDVIHYFGFNTQKPPFNDVRVRQAFAYALDRRVFAQLLQGGQIPLQGFVTPGMCGYSPTVGLGFDVERAKQLLAAAGYPGGKGFPPVTLAFRSSYDVRKEAEIAQYLWQSHLGVNVRLQNLDWKVFLSQLKTDPPHLFKLNWYVDYPDPDSFLSLFIHDNGNNYTHWSLPAYDAKVKQAASLPNGATRQALYQALQQQLLAENTVIVPIYTVNKSYMLAPHVKGLTINRLNILDLSQVYVHQ
jgi:oligopeptide transport system substrate-binding protein